MKNLNTWLKAATIGAALTASAGAIADGHGGHTLRWGMTGDAISLDPQGVLGAVEVIFLRNVYDGLMVLDGDNQPIYGLAESHEVLADGTLRFNLRKGVKFHGGQDFSADDVVFSINRTKGETSAFKSMVAAVASAEKVDDYTVDLKMARPDPLILSNLANTFIMDSGWAAEHGVEAAPGGANKGWYTENNMNGTGMLKLVEREPTISSTFVRNENFWGDAAGHYPGNINKLITTTIGAPSTRVATLLSGDLDLVTEVPLPDLGRVDGDSNLKVEGTAQLRTIFFGFNLTTDNLKSTEGNPFANPEVRKAVSVALDRNLIKKKIMRGVSVPTTILAFPGTHGHTDELAAVVKGNPKKAKEMLAAAGYPDGFSIQLDCPNNRYVNDEAICQAAVSMLAKAGIKVNLNALPKDQWMPLLLEDKSDFYMLGFGTPTNDPLFVFGHIYNKGPFHTGYANAEITDLIGQAAVETDADKRRAMMEQITKVAQDEMPVVPVHYQMINWGMTNDLSIPVDFGNMPNFRYAVMK
jgi:peptide/nickel transport system substrate-binding protein